MLADGEESRLPCGLSHPGLDQHAKGLALTGSSRYPLHPCIPLGTWHLALTGQQKQYQFVTHNHTIRKHAGGSYIEQANSKN